MRASIIPSQILLPQSSVKLGRFITNIKYPNLHHHDPPSESTALETERAAYTHEHYIASNAGLGSALSSVLSSRFSKRTKVKVRVTTQQFKTYALDNPGAWFNEVTRLPKTRSWIEQTIDQGDNIYLIVGFHTITDAHIYQESLAGHTAGGKAQVPIGLSLAALGAVAPLGDIIDPSIDFQQEGVNRKLSHFLARGEQVCAIEYCEIRHAWLSSKHIDKARLSNVRQWSTMERARDEEDGEDDIIEVELEEIDQLDSGDWDKLTVEDSIVFIESRS